MASKRRTGNIGLSTLKPTSADWCQWALVPFTDPRVGSVATRLVRYAEPGIIDSAGDGYTAMGHAYKRLEREPCLLYTSDAADD